MDEYQTTPSALKEAAGLVPCQLSISKITDERQNSEQLAKFQDSTVFGENFTSWLNQRFEVLTSMNKSALAPSLALNISVKKAYLRLLPSTLGASIILDVQFSDNKSNILKQHVYRGDDSGANWSFSHSEIMDRVNNSATEAMTRILEDVHFICANITPKGTIVTKNISK